MEIKKKFKTRKEFKEMESKLTPYLGKQVRAICGNFKDGVLMTVNIDENYDIEDVELILQQ